MNALKSQDANPTLEDEMPLTNEKEFISCRYNLAMSTLVQEREYHWQYVEDRAIRSTQPRALRLLVVEPLEE